MTVAGEHVTQFGLVTQIRWRRGLLRFLLVTYTTTSVLDSGRIVTLASLSYLFNTNIPRLQDEQGEGEGPVCRAAGANSIGTTRGRLVVDRPW